MGNNKVSINKKISKYVEFMTTKVKLIISQKKFTENNVTYKYIFKKKSENELIVICSSCTRKGIKARYNYMRTLNGVKASQLYILDDFAKDHRGSYYMGSDCRFDEEKVVIDLIKSFAEKYGTNKLIFCGSSKGGYASLNLGLCFPNAQMIVGGPQYFLGDYLVASGNDITLEHIIGDKTPEKIKLLNEHLKKKIENNKYKDTQKIHIHFSDKEHTYEEHIKYLMEALMNNGYNVERDIASYANHSDISYYFPEFLIKTVNNILAE